jgi:predicted nucleic acid-binding protein
MILYLDTSSLVKLYVKEKDSTMIKRWVKESTTTASSLVAYAEARAAFSRRYREKAFRPGEYRRLVSGLDEDWENYLLVKVTRELVRMAGDLAEKHSLKGFDAIHLSSALILREESEMPVVFSCADKKLQRASVFENLGQPDAE